MKLKICGNNQVENMQGVAHLAPDYMGFIFYEPSPRNLTLPTLPPFSSDIEKVGVFVESDIDFIKRNTLNYGLDILQLHGKESPLFCEQLARMGLPIWKVFSVGETFDFAQIKDYEPFVDAFLFDTKGQQKGGNGVPFDWRILVDYPSKKPFVLSGGIGLENINEIQHLLKTNVPLMAVDVNSRFEIQPGFKDIKRLEAFIHLLNTF